MPKGGAHAAGGHKYKSPNRGANCGCLIAILFIIALAIAAYIYVSVAMKTGGS